MAITRLLQTVHTKNTGMSSFVSSLSVVTASTLAHIRSFHSFPFFRWFKFTLKPPYSIARGKLRLAIWDTSFWTFWLKFGHKGP